MLKKAIVTLLRLVKSGISKISSAKVQKVASRF
uniref:Uncharacterized protein n=1 Tax=Anguilla anguilla TaxID=7936 RepID=A0A0E9VLE4_ANGAN